MRLLILFLCILAWKAESRIDLTLAVIDMSLSGKRIICSGKCTAPEHVPCLAGNSACCRRDLEVAVEKWQAQLRDS